MILRKCPYKGSIRHECYHHYVEQQDQSNKAEMHTKNKRPRIVTDFFNRFKSFRPVPTTAELWDIGNGTVVEQR